MSVPLGREERAPFTRLGGLCIDAVADLIELTLYQRVVFVTIGMIARKYLQSFILPVLGYEPSGTLGHNEETHQLSCGIKCLKQTWDFP
jgi:hypothetical protein